MANDNSLVPCSLVGSCCCESPNCISFCNATINFHTSFGTVPLVSPICRSNSSFSFSNCPILPCRSPWISEKRSDFCEGDFWFCWKDVSKCFSAPEETNARRIITKIVSSVAYRFCHRLDCPPRCCGY